MHIHSATCVHSSFVHSRMDPTRTTTLRARYERDLVRRMRKVQAAIVARIESDTFRLFTNAPADKVSDFMSWLETLQNREVLEITRGQSLSTAASTSWQNLYLKAAYKKGMTSAANNVRSAGAKVVDTYVDAAFRRPFHADPVGLVYTQAYTDLNGITKAMDTRISQTLSQSMIQGLGAKDAAKKLYEAVDTIGINRARVLARTSIIGAYSEATLNTYKEANIAGVNAKSEFSSTGDNKVCPKCAELEGTVYTIEEARGVIPVHPNCRCAWLPYIEDASGLELR